MRLLLSALVVLLTFVAGVGAAQAFDARGSARQVYATGLAPGQDVALIGANGKTLKTKRANPQGGSVFRNVKPGGGYRVAQGGARSGPLTVLTEGAAPPSTSVYDQQLPSSGYGYLTTRDGTQLAINVHPPQDITKVAPVDLPLPPPPSQLANPVLIEYAGYGYADPAGPQSGIATVANLMGFTVVDVNMRGTGCSGGAFDFFEPLQGLDGYDVI